MYDAIIRGGRIVDGLGGPARTADLAIQDGRIAEIGKISAPARETIDADGAVVTPGFVDIHTHYDGQFMWDDKLDPSFSHGVTTVVAGNCGVGFAPVDEHHRELMELMEGVEDIPGIVLDEGLDWSWRTFPDYLNKLASRQYAMDIACQLTHAPIRVYVMGERALRHEAATAEDIAAMAELVREGMAAGAIGFSNGRIANHASSKGNVVPGTFAEREELLALARAMGEGGHGVFQFAPKGANGASVLPALPREERLAEHRLIEAIARASGRPITYSVLEYAADPQDLHMMVAESERAAAEGLQIRPQTSARGLGAINMLDAYHVFVRKPSYRAIAHLPRAQLAAAMREPARRAAILSEPNVDGEFAANPFLVKILDKLEEFVGITYVLPGAIDYEPTADRRVDVLARAAGKTPLEFLYDLYSEGDGANFNIYFPLNYARGTLDHVHEMLSKPIVVTGLADGGAHNRFMCDGSMPTFHLAFWARDRARGERLPLELVVRKLTKDNADLYGFRDRGELSVGKRADINVVDFDNLTLKTPGLVRDLPSGAGRLLQASEGYLATFVAGTMTRRRDQDAGARPGRLVRSRAAA